MPSPAWMFFHKGKTDVKIHGQILTLKILKSDSVSRVFLDLSLLKFQILSFTLFLPNEGRIVS